MSVDELKQLQLKIIKKNKICNIISFVFFVFFSIVLLKIIIPIHIEAFNIVILFFLNAIICALLMAIIKSVSNGKDINKFYKEFKNIFVLKTLQRFFENIDYKSEEGFTKEYIDDVGMLDTGDRIYSNDYISGTYKDIKFEQSDIHIEKKHEEEDDDGNKEEVWETIFMGRLMVFDFNKNFKANIQVVSHTFSANTLPWKKKFSNVKMEDIEFNKNFSVYAESEHEAFYILTPHFMEKIKDITKKLNCGVMFGFVDSRLHIAIDNNDDSFEYNVFKPINEQEIEEDIDKDIRIITNFVDELNLDNNLFGKEV